MNILLRFLAFIILVVIILNCHASLGEEIVIMYAWNALIKQFMFGKLVFKQTNKRTKKKKKIKKKKKKLYKDF